MRVVTETFETCLANSNVPYVVLLQLDFIEGTLRFCNAGYNFEWNGFTWLGTGRLGSISPIEEGLDLQMYGCSITLSGIPSEYIAASLGTGYAGRDATIWIGPLTEDYQFINDPVIIFKGKMDTMPLKLGKNAAIQLTVESRLINWERPKSRRYNNEDQQSQYPNDKGFEFVPQMVEKEIYWGRLSNKGTV